MGWGRRGTPARVLTYRTRTLDGYGMDVSGHFAAPSCPREPTYYDPPPAVTFRRDQDSSSDRSSSSNAAATDVGRREPAPSWPRQCNTEQREIFRFRRNAHSKFFKEGSIERRKGPPTPRPHPPKKNETTPPPEVFPAPRKSPDAYGRPRSARRRGELVDS